MDSYEINRIVTGGKTNIPAPRPCQYAGISFRSTTEAQRACLFDELGLEWIYEPGAYPIGMLKPYIPDFWLSGLDIFVESKACEHQFDYKAREIKAKGLARSTGKIVIMMGGISGLSAVCGGVGPDDRFTRYYDLDKSVISGVLTSCRFIQRHATSPKWRSAWDVAITARHTGRITEIER